MSVDLTKKDNKVEVRNPDVKDVPIITNEDCELSSFIYITCSKLLSLAGHEYDRSFIIDNLNRESLNRLMNIYLAVLEKKEKEKFDKLKSDKGFDPSDILDSLEYDLKNEFGNYSFILDILKTSYERENEGLNYVEQQINRLYFKEFFDGLGLNHGARILFFLALVDRELKWIFPNKKNHRYNAGIFSCFCNFNIKAEVDYAQKLNIRLIELGLFSEPWTIQEHIYSFFTGENKEVKLSKIDSNEYCDFYDYTKVVAENKTVIGLITDLTATYSNKTLGSFQIISGSSDYRLRNFLNYIFNDTEMSLYEIQGNYEHIPESEMEFLVYANSIMIQAKYPVLYIGQKLMNRVLETSDQESFFYGYLKNLKIPVIMHMDNVSSEKIELLENQRGISVIYNAQIDFAEAAKNLDNISKYFSRGIPVHLISTVVDVCTENEIPPEKWQELTEIAEGMAHLSRNEVREILENKYPVKISNVRSNPCYMMDALNTTVPVDDITEAIENFVSFKKEHRNSDLGMRIQLHGITGGGKSAFAEEVSKKVKKKLEIVKASDILDCYVGETEKRIKEVFEKAANDDAILLLDEADTFISERKANGPDWERSKVNEFLVQMERFSGILFCSTNLPDSLDKATDRRFHFKVGFNPLTKEGVEKLCNSYFSEYNLSESQIMKIYNSGDVTPGDFGVLYGKLCFVSKQKKNADYICDEMCSIVSGKKRSWENKHIGFGA